MKKPLNQVSIRLKLWSLSAVIFILLILFQGYTLYREREQLKEDFFREARSELGTLSEKIAASLWLYQIDFIEQTLQPLTDREEISFLYLSAASGKRVFGLRDEEHVSLLNRFRQSNRDGLEADGYLLIRQAVIYNGETQGYLAAGFNRRWLDEKMFRKIREAILFTGILGALLTLLTALFARALSRPAQLAAKIIEEYFEAGRDPLAAAALAGEGGGAPPPHSRQSSLFQLTPVPLLLADPSGRILQANGSAAEFFETDPAELAAANLEKLLGANDFNIIRSHLAASGGNVEGYLAAIGFPGGRKKIVEINVAVLREAQGEARALLAAILDVSDKFLTQQEILENQHRLAALNQKLLQKTAELEAAHDKNMKYARKLASLIKVSYDIFRCNSNREIVELLVSAGSELVEAEECAVFLWDERKNHLAPVKSHPEKLLQRLRPIGEGRGAVWRTYRENQSFYLAEESVQAPDLAELGISKPEALYLITVPLCDRDYKYGAAVYVQRRKGVFFTEDMHLITALAHQSAITLDKIRLFQALREKAGRLEEANSELKNSRRQVLHLQKMESLGTLVGGIAHDFNNILGIIIPNVDLLRAKAGDREEALKRASIIQTAAERAAELNRQLLMFSRTHEVNLAPLSPNQLIRRLAETLRNALGSRIKIELRLDPAAPPVNADETHLNQALMNLALNARDAMPQGGVLTFQTALQEFTPPNGPAGRYVKISVRDTGAGIAPEHLDKIFDPFFTTKSVDQGSGLGLAVVYGIVQSHGGHIAVESRLQKGTAFHVYLKPAEIAAPAAVPAPAPAANGHENILIVDDEAGIRETLSELLVTLGYNVLAAESGENALRIARSTPNIHVAIVDYTMPHMDGIATVKAIHRIDAKIRILLSSGYADQEKIIHKYSHIDGFLPKPYHMNEVAKILKETIRKRGG